MNYKMPNKNKNNRVLVAMSGGVDSSVAAILLKQRGFEVIGITIKTYNFSEYDQNVKRESGCCSLDAIYDAKNVALSNKIPHFTIDFSNEFKDVVINNFISEYLNARTPNPCVLCNRHIKWNELLKKADELDAFFIATGHYAITFYDTNLNRYCIKQGKDKFKDQSYALWGLSQEQLERTLFPIGDFNKSEIRELAKKFNLKTAQKPDSQEICFITDNKYENFLNKAFENDNIKISKGYFIYNGKVVGEHKGIPYYTVGQRRGLNVALGKPIYVKKINKEDNTIELGDENDILHRRMSVSNINFVSYKNFEKDKIIYAKIRYADKPSQCRLIDNQQDYFIFEFIEPKKAITPGQSAVFYNEQGLVLAGGIIEEGY